jgi:hypothetical protein
VCHRRAWSYDIWVRVRVTAVILGLRLMVLFDGTLRDHLCFMQASIVLSSCVHSARWYNRMGDARYGPASTATLRPSDAPTCQHHVGCPLVYLLMIWQDVITHVQLCAV